MISWTFYGLWAKNKNVTLPQSVAVVCWSSQRVSTLFDFVSCFLNTAKSKGYQRVQSRSRIKIEMKEEKFELSICALTCRYSMWRMLNSEKGYQQTKRRNTVMYTDTKTFVWMSHHKYRKSIQWSTSKYNLLITKELIISERSENWSSKIVSFNLPPRYAGSG